MSRWFQPVQLGHLVLAHVKEVTRQPAVLFWGIIFPMLISLGLGLAFTRQAEVERHVAVISDNAATAADVPRSDVDALLSSRAVRIADTKAGMPRYQLTIEDDAMGRTRFVLIETGWSHAMKLLKQGRISLILKESGSGGDQAQAQNQAQNQAQAQGPGPGLTYHFDPLNPEAQLSYLKFSKLMSGKTRSGSSEALISRGVQPIRVEGARYIDFLIPGLISMGVMMSCMWGISYGMIEKRSKKMLRRMVATPMRKSHFLMALMVVRVAMNFIEAGILFLFAALVFDISIQGSLPALFVIFVSGNIAFGGIAILTSSHTANTEVGNGLINAVVLPMSVLSGIFFSYHNFPDWSLPVIEKLPLTLLADGIRRIFIQGAGFAETAVPSMILLAIGVGFFSLGLRVFRWH